MKYTGRIPEVFIAAGALVIVGAATAGAETTPTTAVTSTVESTTATSTPAVDHTTSVEATTSVTPTPTTTAPMTTTTTPVAPKTRATAAGPGALRVDTGAFTVARAAEVGDVLPGTVEVTVIDTRPNSVGWTAAVTVSEALGAQGNAFSPGPGSSYRAQNTACSESAGQVPLGEDAVVVATAHKACPAATWTADVGIAVPADTPPDAYRLTITHSVY